MSALSGWVRPALSGLTTRGRSFLAAGAAAGICAVLLGQRDLLRVAVLLVVLPLGCALILGRARYRLALTRTIVPQRVICGSTARIRLELENLTRLSTRVLLAEDRVPYSLGPSPRFVLARLPGGRRAAVSYSLRSELRGRFTIGPLRLRLADPFGMCELTRSFTATDPLIVVPRTWPLSPLGAGGQWAGAGESLSRNAAASGEDDVATREYRQGDDLRRVHWRSTARRGELMVRRDEQPKQMRATVLLDCRRDGHRGDGPASSFEWAVSAAASVAVHLAEQRYGIRLLLDSEQAPWIGPHGSEGAGELLDQLAIVGMGSGHELSGPISALGRGTADGMMIAVLGEVSDGEAMALARLGGQGVHSAAILLRTTEWVNLPAYRVQELDETRARAAALLRSGGWVVAEAGPQETVTDAWQRLATEGSVGRSGSWISPMPQPGSDAPSRAGYRPESIDLTGPGTAAPSWPDGPFGAERHGTNGHGPAGSSSSDSPVQPNRPAAFTWPTASPAAAWTGATGTGSQPWSGSQPWPGSEWPGAERPGRQWSSPERTGTPRGNGHGPANGHANGNANGNGNGADGNPAQGGGW